jgi:hypothetical protein
MSLQFTVRQVESWQEKQSIYRRERGDRRDFSILGFPGALGVLGGEGVWLQEAG